MESSAKLVNVSRQHDSKTYNNAVTHSTSLNSVLDLFFIAGACRKVAQVDIERMLLSSWVENPDLTLRLIFWAGDIRQGAGERRFFKIALYWLERNHPETLEKNLRFIPEFSRWDTLFTLSSPSVVELVHDGLVHQKNALLAKWLPRRNQYNNFALRFRTRFNLSAKTYRKLIVGLSDTVEQKMCANEWDKIVYSHVPSVAFNKYRKAFGKRDEARFTAFLESVKKGESKINASAIFPHDIYKSFLNSRFNNDYESIDLQWSQLPDYLKDSDERFLPVCDVSGSMIGDPMAISIALGVYLSERNNSIFKNAFITFSTKPQMEYLKGTVTQRFRQLQKAHWEMSTNLNAVFTLLLESAIRNELTQNDMPTKILIISDMEFNACCRLTNYEAIEEQYLRSKFQIPEIIFWNVNGRPGNIPVSRKQKGVALISGASPSIVKSVLGGTISPEKVMLQTLESERYNFLEI